MLLDFQRDFAATIRSPVEGPMRVYRNTVLSGCVDALRANYPVVARLLGDEMFDAVAGDYAAQCPPRKPVLAMYGARFPDWIEEQPWVQELPYVAHVARIERLHTESLFAADSDPLEIAALSGCDDWHAVHLSLHPATRLDWLATPALSIWLGQRDGGEGGVDPIWEAEGVLFVRPSMDVRPIRLERAAHRFLFGVRLGESIGIAAVAAASLYPGSDVASMFSSLVNAGAFALSSHRSLP